MDIATINRYLEQPPAEPIFKVKDGIADPLPPRRMVKIVKITGTTPDGPTFTELAHQMFIERPLFNKDDATKYGDFIRKKNVAPPANAANAANAADAADAADAAEARPVVVLQIDNIHGDDARRKGMAKQTVEMPHDEKIKAFWAIIAKMNENPDTNWALTMQNVVIKNKKTETFINSCNMIETNIIKYALAHLMGNLIKQGYKWNLFHEANNDEFEIVKTSKETLLLVTSSIVANGQAVYQEALETRDTFALWVSGEIGMQDFTFGLPKFIRDDVVRALNL